MDDEPEGNPPPPFESREAELADALNGVTPIVYEPDTRLVTWYSSNGSGRVITLSWEVAKIAAAALLAASEIGRLHSEQCPPEPKAQEWYSRPARKRRASQVEREPDDTPEWLRTEPNPAPAGLYD